MTNTKQNGSANRKPVDYTLHLRFDVAQTTKALQFEFISTDGHSPMKTVGGLAGTCNFMPGDTIKIMVTATGLDSASTAASKPSHGSPKSQMHFSYPPDFSVIDCTLVSVGTLGHLETPHLSLFDEHNAVTNITEWGFLHQELETLPGSGKGKPSDKTGSKPDGSTKAASMSSLDVLTVTAKNGQWAIAGYLSVHIKTQSGDGLPRLFYFDPEGSAGSGGGLGLGD